MVKVDKDKRREITLAYSANSGLWSSGTDGLHGFRWTNCPLKVYTEYTFSGLKEAR